MANESRLGKPDGYYSGQRKDLIDLVPPGYRSVLDVGCGEGNNTPYLRQKGATYVAGIEITPENAAIARTQMDEVWCGSVEAELPFQVGQFDLIICADVLEHLVDPWAALRKLRRLLSSSGYVVASIPNIRYLPVLFELLVKGRFRYVPAGVLDRTHLRFFTRLEIINLFEVAGFEIVSGSRNRKGRKLSPLNRVTLGLFNDFFTMQYYVLARPRAADEQNG
ncbi:MAG: class I SAM-dependent methyltransferase [Clostridia bacterium]|nr:MAG: class I SAM-dependent methyltransferase [Clostridia bacterium]